MDHGYLHPQTLEAFVAVMSAGSITGAAQLLGRSQPAVTRAIQDLESELQVVLFRRNGPRIIPTDVAVRLLGEAERTLFGLRHLRERAAALAEGRPQTLEIASIPSLASGLVPRALAALPGELRPAHMHVQAVSAEVVVRSLLSRGTDLGLASAPVDHPGLDVCWWGEAPCVAVLAAGDPLADKSCIKVADLRGRCLISLANPFRLRRRVDEALHQDGIAPRSIVDANSSAIALSLVRALGGVAILEPVTAYGAAIEGVCVRPLAVNIPFIWAVVMPTGMAASPVAERLVETLHDAAKALLPSFRCHADMPQHATRAVGGRDGDRA